MKGLVVEKYRFLSSQKNFKESKEKIWKERNSYRIFAARKTKKVLSPVTEIVKIIFRRFVKAFIIRKIILAGMQKARSFALPIEKRDTKKTVLTRKNECDFGSKGS